MTITVPRIKILSANTQGFTCGVCGGPIGIEEKFAAVLYEMTRRPDTSGWTENPNVTREARHLGDCTEWQAVLADEITVRDILLSSRFRRETWGRPYPVRVLSVGTTRDGIRVVALDQAKENWAHVPKGTADSNSGGVVGYFPNPDHLVHVKRAAA